MTLWLKNFGVLAKSNAINNNQKLLFNPSPSPPPETLWIDVNCSVACKCWQIEQYFTYRVNKRINLVFSIVNHNLRFPYSRHISTHCNTIECDAIPRHDCRYPRTIKRRPEYASSPPYCAGTSPTVISFGLAQWRLLLYCPPRCLLHLTNRLHLRILVLSQYHFLGILTCTNKKKELN